MVATAYIRGSKALAVMAARVGRLMAQTVWTQPRATGRTEPAPEIAIGDLLNDRSILAHQFDKKPVNNEIKFIFSFTKYRLF